MLHLGPDERDYIRLSPAGRVGSACLTDRGLDIQVVDPSTWALSGQILVRTQSSAFDWFSPEEIIASTNGTLTRVVTASGHASAWVSLGRVDIRQIRRSPRGDRFAVGESEDRYDLDADTCPVWPMSARIVLVDRLKKTRRRLIVPGPSQICDFSPDGSKLLVLSMNHRRIADAYTIDVTTSIRHLVASDVQEAIWMCRPGVRAGRDAAGGHTGGTAE